MATGLVAPATPELILNPIRLSPVAEALRNWTPRSNLGKLIRDARFWLPDDLAFELIEAVKRSVVIESELWGRLWTPSRGWEELGVLSRKVVTNNGVAFIVDAFQNLVELENMKFHGYGTGATAEAVGDSALVTELTTQYNPDNTRPTGTTTENAANIYETVATLSPDAGGTIAITEHGIFSAASGGVLLDRSVFAAVNIVAGSDSLQTTYRLTLTAGG